MVIEGSNESAYHQRSAHLDKCVPARAPRRFVSRGPSGGTLIFHETPRARRLRDGDMLPTRLLTPHQAENDYNIKDTYNYVTVQTDIKLPRVHIAYLEDEPRWRCAVCARCTGPAREGPP